MGGDVAAGSADGGEAVTTRWTRIVPVVLFVAGVLVMLLVGPLVAPKGFRGSTLLELDFYLGLTLGLALVLCWVAIRLPRQAHPDLLLSKVVVAALFYVVMIATTYGWLLLNYEAALAPPPPPAIAYGGSGSLWGVAGILLGFCAAVGASLVAGLALTGLGRLRASAIVPGIVLGLCGVVLVSLAFQDLFHTSLT